MKWRYTLIVLREEEELRLEEIASFGINWLYHRCDEGDGNICEWIWKWQIFNNQHHHHKCKVGICHGSDGFRSSCWSWSRRQSPTTQEGAAHAEGSSSSASTNYWWVVSCLMRTAPCYAIPTTITTITNPTQHYNNKLYITPATFEWGPSNCLEDPNLLKGGAPPWKQSPWFKPTFSRSGWWKQTIPNCNRQSVRENWWRGMFVRSRAAGLGIVVQDYHPGDITMCRWLKYKYKYKYKY